MRLEEMDLVIQLLVLVRQLVVLVLVHYTQYGNRDRAAEAGGSCTTTRKAYSPQESTTILNTVTIIQYNTIPSKCLLPLS